MNEWVEKSIELANSAGYLDKLSKVYPVAVNKQRPLSKEEKNELKKLFEKKDGNALIKKLVCLDKFPIKDPYVAFIRRYPSALDINPLTIKRLSDRLFDMGFDETVKGIEEPKEFNRQIGTLFVKYLPKIGYPLLEEIKFEESENTCILLGSDASLKSYANSKLGFSLTKGLDLIAKVKNTFVVGEAKFLTDFGGHQNAQFADALNLLRQTGRAKKIAILDGVVWIRGKNKMHQAAKQINTPAMSALLVKDYLESLKDN